MIAAPAVFAAIAGLGVAAGLASVWLARRWSGTRSADWLVIGVPLAMLAIAGLAPPEQRIAGAILAAVLLVLAAVDSLTLRLPDALTYPLIVAGLAVAWITGQPMVERVIGAAAAFLTLAGLGLAYRALRRKDGLGLGDAKLAAAGGAWLGWQGLPAVLLVSAGLGLLLALGRLTRQGRASLASPMPFGPPLAAAILLTWLLAARGLNS